MISSSCSFAFFALSLSSPICLFFRCGPQGVGAQREEGEREGERVACVCGLKAKLCQAQLECIASIKCGAHM